MGDSSGGSLYTENEKIDFNIDGAQSINLQNFLQSNASEFICEQCKKSFDTLKGLQIHRGHHKKITHKLNVKKFTRKRRQCQEYSCFIDESDQCHMPITDLDEFLILNNAELESQSANLENQSLDNNINVFGSTIVCQVCNFVSKTRAGLSIHMKLHNKPEVLNNVDVVSVVSPQSVTGTVPKTRVGCPFSPSRTFVDKKRLQNHLEKKHCEELLNLKTLEVTTPSILAESLMNFRNNVPTLRRIPKGARFSAADKYTQLLNNCIDKNSIYAWEQLLTFSYISFNVKGNKDKSLTSKIKENIKKFTNENIVQSKNPPQSLAKRIEAKVNDFDIKGAIRILSSDDKLAPFNEETLSKLKSKHPTATSTAKLEVQPPPPATCSLIVTEQDVKRKINSFHCGSGPGIDGFRPQYFKDIISKTAGAAGERALKAITRFSNFILAGEICDDLKSIFFGASLCALIKKDNEIRPIAIGNALRRLCGKLACSNVQEDAHNYLKPLQVGVATKLGGECIVHAVRKYVHDPANVNKIILKIDFCNAFNSIDREIMLSEIAKHFPKLFNFISCSYSSPSLLFFGKDTISSEVGCQQGDPCGPLSFSVTIHPIVKNIKSELNSWYLDDGSLADDINVIIEDFRMIIQEAAKVGLVINPEKCELFFVSGVVDESVVNEFEQLSPGIRITKKHELEILGVPIFEEGYPFAFEKKLDSMKLLVSRLDEVNVHTAYCLLKNCLFIPKLTYMVRTCAFWKYPDLTSKMDTCLKHCLESILNITFEEIQWIQAGLPISKGGIGIRKISDICLPAFLSSLHGVRNLVSHILPNMDNEVTPHLWDESLECWNSLNNRQLPENLQVQNSWDSINVGRIMSDNFHFESAKDIARFKALQEPESGGWLQVLPSKNLGTAMNDQDFRICIALRLGNNFFTKHKCICGSMVDESGTHGLSCPKNKGTYPRHVDLNQIFHRALTSARIGSTLEPIGLSRDDGKQPDGMTLAPWQKGQRLVWDVTCRDTLAPSYLNISSKVAGSVAENACKAKHKHYSQIKASNFFFVGLAFETMGPWCKESKSIIDKIGHRLIEESGDIRARKFLYNRISLAIQQGNAASVLGTHPVKNFLEEIFYL